MQIFSPSPKSSEGATPRYLSLYLADGLIQAALWSVADGQIIIASTSSVRTFQTEKDAVIETDQALQELGKDSEDVEEVLFGFPSTWVKQGELNDLRKPIVKQITEGLKLKPLGFMDGSETILLKVRAQDPFFSGLVLNVSDNNLEVQIILRGETLGIESVGRSDSIVADLREALARFEEPLGSQKLPAAIYLFSLTLKQKTVEELEQELVAFDWTAHHAFLYTPEVFIWPANTLIESLSKEGGQNLLGLTVDTTAPTTPVDFGFTTVDEHDNLVVPNLPTESVPAFAVEPELAIESKRPSLPQLPQLKLGSFWQPSSKLSHHPFVAGGFLAGLLILFGLWTWFLGAKVTAQVLITPKKQTISQELTLNLDPAATQSDPVKLILPAQQTKSTVTDSAMVAVTGTKKIGEKAVGQVTIFNKTTSDKSLAAGTVLSSASQKFVLDSEVRVASASVTTSNGSETKVFGKATAKVTAQAIGPEGNLAAKSEFKIAEFDLSSFSAENEAALAGGSSKDATVVGAKDVTEAKTKLLDQAKIQAENKLRESLGAGEYFVLTGKSKITDESLDHEVGEEATQLNLAATIEYDAYIYRQSDLKPLAETVLASLVPTGKMIIPESMQILSSPTSADAKTGKLSLQANLSAQVVQRFLTGELENLLEDTQLDQLPAKVSELPGGATLEEVRFQPSVTQRFMRKLPDEENLNIIVK